MKGLPHILVLLLVCGQIHARIPSATRWAVRRSQKQALTTVPELAARNGGSVSRAVREGGLEALLSAYAREGPRLFERIPPRLVLAAGLSTDLVLGTHRATAPFHGAGEALAQADALDLLDRVKGRSLPIQLLIAGAALLLPLLIIPLLHHPFKRREPNETESVPAVPDAVHPAARGM